MSVIFDGYQELYYNYGTPLDIGLNKAGLVLSVCRYSLVFCISPTTEFCFHAIYKFY